jgi:hypothetical protein
MATREEQLRAVPPWQPNEQAWPPSVRAIGQDELGCLGIDRSGNLYWDGKPVEVRHFSLTRWQRVGAVIVGLFAAVAAIATSVQAWVAALR